MRLSFFLLFLWSTAVAAQCPGELSAYFTGSERVGPEMFAALRSDLNEATLIGIGEDTHGSVEFTAMIEHLTAALLEEHDDIGLILETMVGEAVALDEYIHGLRDDYQYIIGRINSTWRYQTPTFRRLMDYLRTVNTTTEQNVSLYGPEVQYVLADRDRLNDYLARVGSDVRLGGFEQHVWQQASLSQSTNELIDLQRAEREFREQEERFTAEAGAASYRQARRHLNALRQFLTIRLQTVEAAKHDLRDLHMAYNILDLIRAGHHEKYVHWAQNAHVGKDQYNGTADGAGRELAKQLGTSYYTIKTDFGGGSFLAYPPDANERGWRLESASYGPVREGTISHCLDNWLGQGQPVGVLDLRRAVTASDTLRNYLSTAVREMNGAGAQYGSKPTTTTVLHPGFDAVLYFRESTPLERFE